MTTTTFHQPRRSVLPLVSLIVAAGALALGTAAMITDDVAELAPASDVPTRADVQYSPSAAQQQSSGSAGECELALSGRVVRC